MKPFRIEIDKNRLDEEWVEQPVLYHQHAVATVEARAVWEQTKARLEVIKAEFDIEIRRDPEAYGLPKVTETIIASAVISQKLVKDAVAAVIKAREELGVLEAAVGALDHRKKALEKLVELSTRDYFSEPKAKGEVMDEVEKRSIRRRGRRKKDDD